MTIGERDFGRLESKVDILLERSQRQDDRLRDVEENRAHDAGRHSAISAGVSLVVAGLTAWLTKHFA